MDLLLLLQMVLVKVPILYPIFCGEYSRHFHLLDDGLIVMMIGLSMILSLRNLPDCWST